MDLREAALSSGRRHPWELARVSALAQLVSPLPLSDGCRILDVGCGDGYTARAVLDQAGRHLCDLWGIDTALPVHLPATEGVRLQRHWNALEGERFQLLMLLDVLEHVADDLAFLREVVSGHLTPRGHVLLTVPAWQLLFGEHDRFLSHHRRYSGEQLAAVARQAGLEVEARGYLFASLLIPRALQILGERLSAPDKQRGLGNWNGGELLTKALAGILGLDNRGLLALAQRGIRLPGLSAWALCRALP